MSTSKFAVVLGSGLLADGNPSEVTAIRARAAASFVRSEPMKLILSGSRSLLDKGEHGKTEAAAMAEICVGEGVSRDELLIEDKSLDTLGNAIFTVNLYLKNETPGTLYVITSPFHMERSLYLFQHVLGPKWTVIAKECEEWSGETRQLGAASALKRAREFFEGIEAGDLDACLKKLLEKPVYKNGQ